MPAPASSPVPSGLDQLAQFSALAPLADAVVLSAFLALMLGPCEVRGRRYPLAALVAVAASG